MSNKTMTERIQAISPRTDIPFAITKIGHVVLNCRDLERSVRFYTQILGFKISGFIAWLIWRGLYLLRVPTLSRKTRLFLEWNWAMFFPPDISHLGYRRTSRRAAAAAAPAVVPEISGKA